MVWRRLALSLLLLIFGTSRLEAEPMYQGHEYDTDFPLVICLDKQAALVFFRSQNSITDGCVTGFLFDFMPLYKVMNAGIHVGPYYGDIIYGRARMVVGDNRFSNFKKNDHEVYVVINAVVLDRDGREVSINDPDFDK